MSRLFVSLCAVLPMVALAAPPPKSAPPKGLPAGAVAKDAPTKDAPTKDAPTKDEADPTKVMYAFGVLIAQRTPLATGGFSEAELKTILKGLTDAALGKDLSSKPDDLQMDINNMLADRQKAAAEKAAAKNGEILAKYAKEKGAEKTASGLIFTNVKAGTGEGPKPTDTVKVHYRGTLTDGTEFDSSYARNEPAQFPLNGVIPCWTEGVGKMKPGGKAKLVCPPAIGYGERGAPPKIGPNAVLVFEVELLSIEAPKAAMPPGGMDPQGMGSH